VVGRGDCAVLTSALRVGKSTLLKRICGSCKLLAGWLLLRQEDEEIDLANATPHQMLDIRRRSIGHARQLLGCVRRVPALDANPEPLLATPLPRLRIPERLLRRPPATFSGGERQRFNIARGFIDRYPLLLLDEPTALLEMANRATVVELIRQSNSGRRRGARRAPASGRAPCGGGSAD
jgi:alpha-D-ribose 1-methylphosphonate 5-triphosphate synthase subunit PhnL